MGLRIQSEGRRLNILKRGDIGEFVVQLQRELSGLSFDVGPHDGIFGPRTEAAVCEFQDAQGLDGDGVADLPTLSSLGLAAPALLHHLPETTTLAGRNYHHIVLDRNQIAASDNGARDPIQPAPKRRPEPTLQSQRSPATSIRFAQLRDMLSLDRPSVLSMWFKPAEISPGHGSSQTLVYVSDHFRIEIADGDLDVTLGDENQDGMQIRMSFPLEQMQWRHVAVRFKTTHLVDKDEPVDSIDPEPGKVVDADSGIARFHHRGYVVDAEVFLDHAPVERRTIFLRAGYEAMPIQFLANNTVRDTQDPGWKLDSDQQLNNGFNGAVAQVEIWLDARETDIERIAYGQYKDDAPAMRWAPERTDGAHTTGLRNVGSSPVGFSIVGDGPLGPLTWSANPDGELPAPRRATRIAFARLAIAEMRRTGVPDVTIVDNADILQTPRDAAAVRRALEGYTDDELVAMFERGYRFLLRPTRDGYQLVFALDQTESTGIVVVEQYALTSFVGKAGRGRLVQTLSLSPGESTTVTVSSFRSDEREREKAQSILDSTSDEASRNFESTLQNQRTSEQERSSEFAYHADVSGQASWGWGSAKADGGVKGAISDNSKDFHDNMSSAVKQHAATASASREVNVSTTGRDTTTQSRDEAVERRLENINLSRPLTTAFYQVNQETFTFLHLVDIRVGFFDAVTGVRVETRLERAHEMLKQYVTPSALEPVWGQIVEALHAITGARLAGLTPSDETGAARYIDNDWSFGFDDSVALAGRVSAPAPAGRAKDMENADDAVDATPTAPPSLIGETGGQPALNRSFATDVWFRRDGERDGTAPFQARLPGLVMQAQRSVMRTDSLVCESMLGDGWALDPYATRLQEAEARRLEAAAERDRAEARLLAARSQVADQIARATTDLDDKVAALQTLDPRTVRGETVLRTSIGGGVDHER